MKNLIKELYNMKIDRLYGNDFFYNDEKIKIIEFEQNEINRINNLVKITNTLFSNRINVSTFLRNNNGKFYFERKNKCYALLKINERENKINRNDLLKIMINNEIDEYNIQEKIINHTKIIEKKSIESENTIIRESINYFSGLSDSCIALLNEYKNNNKYLCHEIKLNNYSKEEYYNPINYIKTNYTYDISNYIKYKFFNNEIDYEEINEILKKILDENDQIYLFSMMLYPNYYFEQVENDDEKNISKIINKISKYEELISFIKNIYTTNNYIQKFNWLK